MKVASRITLGLTTAAVAVFGAYAAVHLRQEENERRAVAERETVLLARTLQVSIENALRDRQSADVKETLERVELVDRSVDIHVLTAGGLLSAAGSKPPDATITAAMARTATSPAPIIEFEQTDRLIVALPLVDDDRSRFGAIAVAQPLDALKQDLAAGLRRAVASTLVVVIAISVLSFLLGNAYIGRPLARLMEQMRRVRSGDLSTTHGHQRNDEVGAVAAEFDAMVKELAEARRRLDEEAASRRRFQRALQEADKLVTVGQLSAGLAHEIGSPLQILSGRARALSAHPDDPRETARVAAILVEQSDRITRIVEQLLRFARRRPLAGGPVDVVGSVRAVLDLLEVEVTRRRLSVQFHPAPWLPVFRGDGDHVQQIALNLIRNAVAATEQGGTVVIRLEPARLPTIDGAGEVDSLRLTVSDTGKGIPDEHLAHLFEPFFTTNVESGGTGLGLSVVKTLAADYGGSVQASSVAGRGATFVVELPCPAAEADRATGSAWR